jgi:hypothetical protein
MAVLIRIVPEIAVAAAIDLQTVNEYGVAPLRGAEARQWAKPAGAAE